ncbi:hypothetical protein [Chromobacterium sp. CV08]|uniref:hypothetical protein n=1 Tax=Chromobacterium sp. CV08 TaxID=3133274 RepID=UPI003DA7D8AA
MSIGMVRNALLKAQWRSLGGVPTWIRTPAMAGLLCLLHYHLYPGLPGGEWPVYWLAMMWLIVSLTSLRRIRNRPLDCWPRFRKWPSWRYDATVGLFGYSQPICAFLIIDISTQTGHIIRDGLAGVLALSLVLGGLLAIGEWKKMEKRYLDAAPVN